jgi:hypothetical protein
MIDNLVCPKCGSVRIYVTHPAKYAIEAYQNGTNTYAERMGFGKAYDTKVFCADCEDVLYHEEREW